MKKPDTSKIDPAWPESGLEHVGKCAYCGSAERTLAYKDVQDWSFYCAPGKWTYWDCTACKSLYLDPRPTQDTIGTAYAVYYTHNEEISAKKTNKYNISKFIQLVKNGYLNVTLGTNYSDNLTFPSWFYRIIGGLGLLPRSPLHDISRRPPGKLLDIGCGGGKFLKFAKELGWEVVGIELDENAAIAARGIGLNVIHGSFSELNQLNQQFDVIVCSHVLEHVYDPTSLIELALSRLIQNGELWIQWPNPRADGRELFGAHWRGLEAPRHIGIPSLGALQHMVSNANIKGFVVDKSPYWLWSKMSMYASSKEIFNKETLSNSRTSIKSLVNYMFSRKKIKQCELCVVTIKR